MSSQELTGNPSQIGIGRPCGGEVRESYTVFSMSSNSLLPQTDCETQLFLEWLLDMFSNSLLLQSDREEQLLLEGHLDRGYSY